MEFRPSDLGGQINFLTPSELVSISWQFAMMDGSTIFHHLKLIMIMFKREVTQWALGHTMDKIGNVNIFLTNSITKRN